MGRKMSPERIRRYQEADSLYRSLESDVLLENVTPAEASQIYADEFLLNSGYFDVEPLPLRYSHDDCNYQAWRDFNVGDKPAVRLYEGIKTPTLYTLHINNFDNLDDFINDETGWTKEFVSDPKEFYIMYLLWKYLGKSCFTGARKVKPAFNDDAIHLHVLADVDAGLPHLSRQGELVKPIKDTFEDRFSTYAYMLKPDAVASVKTLTIYLTMRQKIFDKPRVTATYDVITPKKWRAKNSESKQPSGNSSYFQNHTVNQASAEVQNASV